MISQREFERTLSYVRRTEVHTWLDSQIRITSAGRKRQLQVDVLLAGMLLLAGSDATQLSQTAVHRLLIKELARPVQHTWHIRRADGSPITLRMVRYLWSRITDLFEHTPGRRPEMDDAERARRSDALNELLDRLTGSASMHIDKPHTFAFDQSAIESFARGKSSNRALDPGEDEPNDLEFGRIHDPDARWGYRTKTHDNKSTHSYGYQMNAFTRVGNIGEDAPLLIDRFRLVPGNSHGITESLDVLHKYRRAGIQIKQILADRGLTYSVAETWALPLADLGISQVLDMHPNDRGARLHPKHGYVMIDGWPYVPGIPEHLVRIERPPKMTVGELRKDPTEEERARHAARVAEVERFDALIAEREAYRFLPHGKTSSGARRFKSPARAGKLRCPAYPPSLHLAAVPDCVHPGGLTPKCCIQSSITVANNVDPKLRQDLPWGTPDWIKSFARRTRVEGSFGRLQSPDTLRVRRGWTRQVGKVKTAFALAVVVAAQNLNQLLTWAARTRDTRDPITTMDVTDHGFVEIDADGNPLSGTPPPGL